jgi:hypothetical protein
VTPAISTSTFGERWTKVAEPASAQRRLDDGLPERRVRDGLDELVGMLGEEDDRVGDELRGGVGARRRQLAHVQRDLLARHHALPGAVAGGAHGRDDVVPGIRGALVGQLAQPLVRRGVAPPHLVAHRLRHRVAPAVHHEEVIEAQAAEHRVVALGKVQHRGQRPGRELQAERLHEVAGAVAREALDELDGQPLDAWLERRHARAGELALPRLADRRVLGRVHADERLRHQRGRHPLEERLGHVEAPGDRGARERRGVGDAPLDVLDRMRPAEE